MIVENTVGKIPGGEVKNFESHEEIQNFLEEHGNTIPVSISRQSKYGDMDYCKDWIVHIFMKDGKAYSVPCDWEIKETTGNTEKGKGMTTNVFLKEENIKVADIQLIQLIIRR